MTSYIDKNRGRVSSLKRRGRRFYPSPVSYFLRICPPLRHSVNTRGIKRESMPRVRLSFNIFRKWKHRSIRSSLGYTDNLMIFSRKTIENGGLMANNMRQFVLYPAY